MDGSRPPGRNDDRHNLEKFSTTTLTGISALIASTSISSSDAKAESVVAEKELNLFCSFSVYLPVSLGAGDIRASNIYRFRIKSLTSLVIRFSPVSTTFGSMLQALCAGLGCSSIGVDGLLTTSCHPTEAFVVAVSILVDDSIRRTKIALSRHRR